MIVRNFKVELPNEGFILPSRTASYANEWLEVEKRVRRFYEFEIDLRDWTIDFWFTDELLAAEFKLRFC